jgi:O-antigen ligase
MEKSRFRTVVDTLLDHNLYRLVVLVMVVLRTCAFINPVIGPLVKFTLAWSAAILVKDVFTERLFMTNRFRGALYLFLIAYGVTALVNRDQNFARNLVMWAYIISNMLVMYSYDLKKSPGTVKKELLRFNHTFMWATFIGQAISLVTFFLNISFAYSVSGTVYYYGIYQGRIWGFYTNPNAASFFMVINLCLTVVSIIIQKENLSRGRKCFYLINNLVQLLILFLCNSRTSIFTLCFYIAVLVVLMTLPDILWCKEKPERRKKIGKTVFVALVIPLAILGTHTYALDILPEFVLTTPLSESLNETLEEVTHTSSTATVTAGDVELERESYGTQFGGRYYLWQAGIEMIKDHPLFGVGSDNVPTEAYRYAARYFTAYGEDIYLPGVSGGLHNLFFQITAASGLVGLAAFILFGILVLQRAVRYYIWMIRKRRFNPLAVACLCVVLIIVMRTMTDTGIVYGIYYLGVVFWTYLSASVYFMDSEFTVGRKPFFAAIHDKLFTKK